MLMGKNKPLVNFKDSREILLGRKMRSGIDQRLKVIGSDWSGKRSLAFTKVGTKFRLSSRLRTIISTEQVSML